MTRPRQGFHPRQGSGGQVGGQARRPAAPDPRQASLFAEARPVPAAGSLQFDAEWRAALNEAIARSEISREAIAARMELLLGSDPDYPVSKALLDAWTASSKTALRIPLIYLPAFVEATGARWLIDWLAFKCGCAIVDETARDVIALGAVKQDQIRLKKIERELIKKMRVGGR